MKHAWVDSEVWGRKALRCGGCGLAIVDFAMPPAVKVGGKLHVSLAVDQYGEPIGLGDGSSLPAGEPVRWQVGDVLDYSFEGRTRGEVISYAEDAANKVCRGGQAKWA